MSVVPIRPTDRTSPHNLDAEESLLGAMLLSRDAIAVADEVVSTDDFYKPTHGHVFEAIQALYAQGEPADPVTVADELRRAGLLDAVGGAALLSSLQANTPAIANASHYAHIVEEHALLRRLISVGSSIAEMGYALPDDVVATIDRAESMVFEVAQRRVTDSMSPLRDLLSDTLDRLEALYERGESITGVPTGFTDLDERLSGLQPSSLIIIGARPAMGKCVAGDTLLVDAITGARRTMHDVYKAGRKGDNVTLFGVNDDQEIVIVQPSAFIDDGVKAAFRVRTRLGREVTTTALHPFLTREGWRALHELEVGEPIAVPAVMNVFGTSSLHNAELILLGYLCSSIGERGVRCRVDAHDPIIAADARAASDDVGDLVALARRCAVDRTGSQVVPNIAFEFDRTSLARFLNRFLAPDTSVRWSEAGEGCGRIVCRTNSSRAAADLQHLLLRFGFVAQIRRHIDNMHPRRLEVHDVELTRDADLIAFIDEIGVFGKEVALDILGARLVAKHRGHARQALQQQVWTKVLQARDTKTWREMDQAVRGTGGLATASREPSDLLWDPITSITPVGEVQVYDLTVSDLHNFVASDVCVHNTAFALNVAAHAAQQAHEPVLLFSLEMSHLELTQRLLCAEARVDSSRMRNGRLHESDWPKISHAIGRLGETPLYIDDSPHTTVMDIRAKSRRLKSKEGLSLVIIDYIQLMSGRSNAENRQVEVSEMSRGLKILARELEVPVMALSQLSRNLETRADKRPVLADLRESGSLEQDADVVMFLYRDEIYNSESSERGTAEIIVSKHRNGPTGTTHLAFLDHYTRFANMART